MNAPDLPTEIRLAEECCAALDRGDVAAARPLAERGLELSTAIRSAKWVKRFQNLLNMCSPQAAEPSSAEPIQCSFCQSQSLAAGQVVAGPKVFICTQCIRDCGAATSESTGIGRLYTDGVQCSFCNGRMSSDTPAYLARGNCICSGCVEVCRGIFAERGRRR